MLFLQKYQKRFMGKCNFSQIIMVMVHAKLMNLGVYCLHVEQTKGSKRYFIELWSYGIHDLYFCCQRPTREVFKKKLQLFVDTILLSK